jgi:4-amino-4-deoxy-L-arabinose transferase-like glycosyltransferase
MDTQQQSSRWIGGAAPWLLLIVAAWLLLPGLNTAPLFDRDEPRFARAAVEMMERGEWAVPYFNGAYRFDKPPLTYWLMWLPYSLFGVTEASARLHTVVSAALLALLLYRTGRRWASPAAGFAAGFGMLTCVQMLIHGRVAVADMPMILCVTLSQIALFELLHGEGRRSLWFWTLYLSLGVGFLAKGPIAWAVPLLSLLLHRFLLYRKPLPWRSLRLARGLPLTALLVAAWGVPALVRTGGAFWEVGMGRHVIERGVNPFNARSFIPGLYLLTALLSLFPWIGYLGPGIRAARSPWDARARFLVAWLVSPYLIFSFYATQLPHYVMPAFPAFFLLMGRAMESPLPEGAVSRGFRAVLFGAVALVAAASAAAAALAELPPEFASARLLLAGFGMILGGLLALGPALRRRSALLLAVGLLPMGPGFGMVGIGLRPLLPSAQLAPFLRGLPEHVEFACRDCCEPSLVFYGARPWARMESPEQAARFLARPGRLLLALESKQDLEDALAAAWAGKRGAAPAPDLETRPAEATRYRRLAAVHRRVRGINLATSELVDLALYYNPPPPPGDPP